MHLGKQGQVKGENCFVDCSDLQKEFVYVVQYTFINLYATICVMQNDLMFDKK